MATEFNNVLFVTRDDVRIFRSAWEHLDGRYIFSVYYLLLLNLPCSFLSCTLATHHQFILRHPTDWIQCLQSSQLCSFCFFHRKFRFPCDHFISVLPALLNTPLSSTKSHCRITDISPLLCISVSVEITHYLCPLGGRRLCDWCQMLLCFHYSK